MNNFAWVINVSEVRLVDITSTPTDEGRYRLRNVDTKFIFSELMARRYLLNITTKMTQNFYELLYLIQVEITFLNTMSDSPLLFNLIFITVLVKTE